MGQVCSRESSPPGGKSSNHPTSNSPKKSRSRSNSIRSGDEATATTPISSGVVSPPKLSPLDTPHHPATSLQDGRRGKSRPITVKMLTGDEEDNFDSPFNNDHCADELHAHNTHRSTAPTTTIRKQHHPCCYSTGETPSSSTTVVSNSGSNTPSSTALMSTSPSSITPASAIMKTSTVTFSAESPVVASALTLQVPLPHRSAVPSTTTAVGNSCNNATTSPNPPLSPTSTSTEEDSNDRKSPLLSSLSSSWDPDNDAENEFHNDKDGDGCLNGLDSYASPKALTESYTGGNMLMGAAVELEENTRNGSNSGHHVVLEDLPASNPLYVPPRSATTSTTTAVGILKRTPRSSISSSNGSGSRGEEPQPSWYYKTSGQQQLSLSLASLTGTSMTTSPRTQNINSSGKGVVTFNSLLKLGSHVEDPTSPRQQQRCPSQRMVIGQQQPNATAQQRNDESNSRRSSTSTSTPTSVSSGGDSFRQHKILSPTDVDTATSSFMSPLLPQNNSGTSPTTTTAGVANTSINNKASNASWSWIGNSKHSVVSANQSEELVMETSMKASSKSWK